MKQCVVPGHNNTQSHYSADELCRNGTAAKLPKEFLILNVPLRICRLIIDDAIKDPTNSKCKSISVKTPKKQA